MCYEVLFFLHTYTSTEKQFYIVATTSVFMGKMRPAKIFRPSGRKRLLPRTYGLYYVWQ